jgi:hypothetical protein
VYWFGHVDDQKHGLPEGVDILDASFFEPTPVPYAYIPVHETPVEDDVRQEDPPRAGRRPRRAANV